MIKRFKTSTIFLAFLIALCALSSARVDFKKCSNRNGLFPKPGSLCRAYYKCTNWNPEEMICPAGQHFSTITDVCEYMHLFPCFEKKECPRENGRFLKPGTGCRSFYDCCNGNPKEKQCPRGQLFDPSRERCEWEEHYTCIENVSTNGPTTNVIYTTHAPSTMDEGNTSKIPKETPHTEYTNQPSSSSSPMYPTTASDFKHVTSTPDKQFSSTEGNFHTSTATQKISETSPNSFESSPTSHSELPETSTAGATLSTRAESSTYFLKETTPGDIIYSTTLSRASTPEEIAQSTTSIRESTPEEIAQSTTSIRESTPEEIAQSTALIRESTIEEIAQSTTSIRESTPEEIVQSTTSIKETTPEEIIRSTTFTSETDERTTMPEKVPLSTTDIGQITNEPNILCPEPFGYFPHPTDKHKFVGCVDNIPSVLTCPSDLIYNHEFKQCVYE